VPRSGARALRERPAPWRPRRSAGPPAVPCALRQGRPPSTAGFLVSGAIAAAAMVQAASRSARRAASRHISATRCTYSGSSASAVTSRAMLFGFDALAFNPERAYLIALWLPVVASTLAVELVFWRKTCPAVSPFSSSCSPPLRERLKSPESLVQEKLLVPLAARENARSSYSRARPPAAERRVRMLDGRPDRGRERRRLRRLCRRRALRPRSRPMARGRDHRLPSTPGPARSTCAMARTFARLACSREDDSAGRRATSAARPGQTQWLPADRLPVGDRDGGGRPHEKLGPREAGVLTARRRARRGPSFHREVTSTGCITLFTTYSPTRSPKFRPGAGREAVMEAGPDASIRGPRR